LDSLNPARQLKGVFLPPEDTVVSHFVELPERPGAEYAAWDGASVVVYDTETKAAHDFGPGNLWQPAFGKDYLVYTSENQEVYVVDLATMQKRYMARGVLAYALGDSHIVINPGDNAFYAMKVSTGERVEIKDVVEPLLRNMVKQRWGGAFQASWVDGRYSVHRVEHPEAVCEQAGVEQRVCLADQSSKWVIDDVETGEVLYAFVANQVEPAGPAEVVVATLPVCPEAGSLTECDGLLARLEAQNPGVRATVQGTTNLFVVDMNTGDATFIATATYNAATDAWPMKWPLVANDQYIAWTESYCGDPRGATRIFNRATGEITELSASEWLVLSGGRLGLGEGTTAVLDAAALQYVGVLPELAGASWSQDLRYAAVGQEFGREGVCN
jgi:hypothetical protein